MGRPCWMVACQASSPYGTSLQEARDLLGMEEVEQSVKQRERGAVAETWP